MDVAGTCRRPCGTQLTTHGRTNAVGACIQTVGSCHGGVAHGTDLSFIDSDCPQLATPSMPRLIACDRRSARANIDQLIQASHDRPGSGSTFNQRVTRTRVWRLFQSMRNRYELTASAEPPGGTTERTSDHPPLAGPAAGCGSRRAPRRVSIRWRRNARNLRLADPKLYAGHAAFRSAGSATGPHAAQRFPEAYRSRLVPK